MITTTKTRLAYSNANLTCKVHKLHTKGTSSSAKIVLCHWSVMVTSTGDYREWVIYNKFNSDFAIKTTDYTFYSEWVIYDNINTITVTLLFKYRSVSDLLASSKFQVSFQCGRAQRSLLHIAAKYFQFDSSFFCFNFLYLLFWYIFCYYCYCFVLGS